MAAAKAIERWRFAVNYHGRKATMICNYLVEAGEALVAEVEFLERELAGTRKAYAADTEEILEAGKANASLHARIIKLETLLKQRGITA